MATKTLWENYKPHLRFVDLQINDIKKTSSYVNFPHYPAILASVRCRDVTANQCLRRFTFDCTSTQQEKRHVQIKWIGAYDVSRLWLIGDDWSHPIIFMCCQVSSLCPLWNITPSAKNPYLSSHSGNYSNEPSLPSRLLYRTTWSVADNVHVILCDVAAHSVTSFPV